MVKKYLLIMVSLVVLFSFYSLYPPSKTWNPITLGASLPLNGINKELGQEVLEGANAYFHEINAGGGIHQIPVQLIHYDDKYEPQNTLKNTQKLINEDQVFALFGFVGTPTTKKILPIIEDIPFIAPYTGASFLRDGTHKNIVNFRSSYDEEIENVVQYLHQTKAITRFAIFYQNDDYGIAGYNATIKALDQRGLTLVAEGTYKRNTLSIRHALHEIEVSSPEAIILVGAYKPSARFIKKWRELYTNKTLFAPISFVNANALIEELDNHGENIYFSLTVPSYDNKSLEVAHEYRKILHRYYPHAKPSYASFESFLAAKAVVTALKNIQGKITQEKFLSRLKNLHPDAIGQIPITYKHTQLLNRVYLSIFHEGKFQLVEGETP
jgi:ABC-type branched-subunit amino acid transport system substrate-binding protein